MKSWKPDENGDLDELFGLAGIPPDEIADKESVTIFAHEYEDYLKTLRELERDVQAIKAVRWQWFVWGLAIGSIVARFV